jgi:glycine/D-amino acid oxidase-like deaminating enzyme/nitrite reductase/ring-hydroxylating ferredoxin subunit
MASAVPFAAAPGGRATAGLVGRGGLVRAESGHTTSLWHATVGDLARPPLDADARADVCVVGAGIAGLMAAYLLRREGRQVIVLDDGPVGGGETGRTTAHLSDALDDRYRVLERLHGEEGARLAAESHRVAIELFHRVVSDESIDADFAWVDGWLFPGESASADDVIAELEAARRAGVVVEQAHDPPFDAFPTRPCLHFPRQARIHALKFLDGLARRFESAGGRIHTGAHVTAVHGGAPVRVETDGGATVLASACIVATNSPISDRVRTHLKQAPYRTFALAARVPSGSVPDALYWEDADPYVYVRIQPGDGHDWLIVGGQDYKTGQREDDRRRLDGLESWTRERFPMAEGVGHRWSGQVLEPADGLAFIGPNPDGADNVYIVTGDSGHGMTHGAIGGVILNDLIAGRHNPWARLYDPSRRSLRAVADLARENLNVAAQMAAWVLPGDVPSEADIPRGAGRVVRRGTRLLAIYRDDDGRLHERSAACTHLRCVVNWNDLERSWDCPCHGSRFDPLGAVLNGPATEPLREP